LLGGWLPVALFLLGRLGGGRKIEGQEYSPTRGLWRDFETLIAAVVFFAYLGGEKREESSQNLVPIKPHLG